MSKESAVFRSLEIIESHISEKLSVENIANGVYFSKHYYGRLFREIVGESVMEYVTKRRLSLAGNALLTTNKTVLDIALDYGYSSHENFIRAFKSYMGVTPTEYRKYKLNAISQKRIREMLFMTYSQNTNEIIRELNEFIVRAKETAETARKCKVKEFTAFWGMIADNTDSLANRLKSSLERITAIAESPDEIGNRFAIIKAVEDVAFETNLLAFNVNLMISRCNPEYVEAQKHLGEMYTELAKASAVKASRITSLFNELSALIFEDMKKFATSKIKHLKDKGREVASGIQETPYLYIKNEIMSIADELSEIPCEQVSIKNIEDFAFRLSIISVAADIDVFRMPSDKNLFCGLKELKNEFYETAEALSGFVGRESNTIVECATGKHFDDIAFQGCILLFYTKGETEKMGYLRENGLLSEKQKEAFAAIFDKINKFVTFTRNATEESEYSKIVDMLYSINEDLCVQADILAQKGSAVSFLAGEFKKLADCVKRCAK